jgi:hypothetical protein
MQVGQERWFVCSVFSGIFFIYFSTVFPYHTYAGLAAKFFHKILIFRRACSAFSGIMFFLYFVWGVAEKRTRRPVCPCLCLLFGGLYAP